MLRFVHFSIFLLSHSTPNFPSKNCTCVPPKKLPALHPPPDISVVTGLPDPPVDVQVEAGPQDGTLLVTWLPVTITNMGTSNGAPVTGYAVYADGKKVSDVDSPTG